MNFHIELRRRSCMQAIKTYGHQQLRILEVHQHRLIVGRRPAWSPCSIRYYPAIGQMLIRGPEGQYIGWADNLADALTQMAITDTDKVLSKSKRLNRKRSSDI